MASKKKTIVSVVGALVALLVIAAILPDSEEDQATPAPEAETAAEGEGDDAEQQYLAEARPLVSDWGEASEPLARMDPHASAGLIRQTIDQTLPSMWSIHRQWQTLEPTESWADFHENFERHMDASIQTSEKTLECLDLAEAGLSYDQCLQEAEDLGADAARYADLAMEAAPIEV